MTDPSTPAPRWVIHPNLFLAASTPSARDLLTGLPTPVNYLPLLLNRYLGTDFALSQDRFFVSCGMRLLLDLVEIKDPDASPSP